MELVFEKKRIVYTTISVDWAGFITLKKIVPVDKNQGVISVYVSYQDNTSEVIEVIKYSKYDLLLQEKDLHHLLAKYRPNKIMLPLDHGQLSQSLKFLKEVELKEGSK